MHDIYFGDNLDVLRTLPSGSVNLIYIDPPFNTGQTRRADRLRVTRAPDGAPGRRGFKDRLYLSERIGRREFDDRFGDYPGFLEPRLTEAVRVLAADGSLYLHVDYREVHYCKILLDEILGRECFLNEIIWAYDYGGRPRRRWPAKHDNILFYVKDPKHYTFDIDAVERIPYMAPGLVTPEKARRGKTPTDTWWHTIVPTSGTERTGYPTQKPLGVLRRIVAASSRPGDVVLDFFAGSGTTGAAAAELGRRFMLVDNNIDAMRVMERRLGDVGPIVWHGYTPSTDGGVGSEAGS